MFSEDIHKFKLDTNFAFILDLEICFKGLNRECHTLIRNFLDSHYIGGGKVYTKSVFNLL